MFLLIRNNQPYISKEFLLQNGVQSETIKKWKTRNRVDTIETETTSYFSYQHIPDNSKTGIPSAAVLIRENDRLEKTASIYKALVKAQTFDFTKFANCFKNDASLTGYDATQAAKLHAVWNSLFELREKGNRDLQCQYEAFRKLYPEKYKGKTGKNSFSNVLRKGREKGADTIAFDRKKYGNNREANQTGNIAAAKYFLFHTTATGFTLSCSDMMQTVNEALTEINQPPVSLSWVKKHRAAFLQNPEIYRLRYGQQAANKKLPSASLHSATFVHEQWQLDGMTMPFWGAKFKRYTLVRLVDSCSKKIVGWSFGESENGALIMEAIRDAVNETGCIPFEVLTDNHSFNQTNEAKHLQSLFAAKGCRWTVTQNPQHKAIIERYNQHLDKHFKRYFGYLGQGIRSKSIDAHPKPEMIDKYCKDFIDESEQLARCVAVVDAYNSTPLSNGKSPNQLFKDNQHTHPIIADIFDRANLLTCQTEKKVLCGQITFKRGIVKHEFQLPAALYQTYNDKVVVVKYEDLNECIYVFDKVTGTGIIDLKPKEKIHNAKANQTPEDVEKLNRHTGRLKGITTRGRKEIESIIEKGHAIDPEAYQRINRLTAPKNVIAELEQKGLLTEAAERGVVVELLHIPERNYNEGVELLKPKQTKVNESPFTPKNHTVKKFDLDKFLND